jgi:hypothetical protein
MAEIVEWLLFNAKWTIFQLYQGENKFPSMNDDGVRFVLEQRAELGLCSVNSLKQHAQVDM